MHVRRVYILTPVLLLLFIFMIACAARRPSRYSGEILAGLRERFAGVTITLQPSRPCYMQGEDIYLRYEIHCAEPRFRPWSGNEVTSRLTLLSNDVDVSKIDVWTSLTPKYKQKDVFYSGELPINGTFSGAGTSEQFGFRHLPPGDYTGYFDHGIVSPDFAFTVTPVPDSLQPLWSRYCALRRIGQTMALRAGDPLLDTLAVVMREFMLRPVGSVWRGEALAGGIFEFELYMPRHAPTEPQLALLDSALMTLAEEPRIPAEWVIRAATYTVCRRETPAETARALLEFARRTHNPAIEAAAREGEERLLSIQRRMSE